MNTIAEGNELCRMWGMNTVAGDRVMQALEYGLGDFTGA
jgi:hypothetical protein